MSNENVQYVVSIDSDYLKSDWTINPNAILLQNIKSIQYQRNIAPSEDTATIVLAGIQKIESAVEVYIYRINMDGSIDLKFRGMTTNPTYDISDEGMTTTVQIESLWYMLSTRLFQIAGKSPPPLQPNTNPYLCYLNPVLNLRFGTIWALILQSSFQTSYSTGKLPSFKLVNTDSDGKVNADIPYLTDFDYVIVNDNMNVQYQSISAVIDRLVSSALFNPDQGSPFLAEYRLDIGDFPYSIPPRPIGSLVDTYPPKLPTLTVMLFDPVHSKLGNGQNRTGINLGDNSLDPNGTSLTSLTFPMSYIEFGVTNGYNPIDTVVFSEGDNIVSLSLTYDYKSMNNSYVLTGGSFQGSDVVAVPIENQRSIAEYGLKQTNQTLANVVDPAEIKRYVGTSINFFQHPIPNITIKPDYTYMLSHPLYAGDYILVNAPSLSGVMEDSNGMPLGGSYATGNVTPVTAAFTARVKTIDVMWNPDEGEDITLTLSFPITNVPLPTWNEITAQKGANAGSIQSMYTTVTPSLRTIIGKNNQQGGAAVHQGGGDFINNRSNPFSIRVLDTPATDTTPLYPDMEHQDISIISQVIPNAMEVSLEDSFGVISPTKGDGILLYQFGTEVDSATNNTTITTVNDVLLTILQPDGMAIYDDIMQADQMANILSLLSITHSSPPSIGVSAPILNGLSGKYQIILRNTSANTFVSNPLLATLTAPTLSGGTNAIHDASWYIICPIIGGHEVAMSFWSGLFMKQPLTTPIVIYWNEYIDSNGTHADGYNIYYTDTTSPDGNTPPDILDFNYLTYVVGLTYSHDTSSPIPVLMSQPFNAPLGISASYNGLTAVNTGSATLLGGHQYWYVVTAINPEGIETECSQATTTIAAGFDNTVALPDAHIQPELSTPSPWPQQIEINWPSIPNAQSYNVYRGTDLSFGYSESSFQLICSGWTNTSFTDDGSYTLGSNPPSEINITAGNNLYTVYVNYSYQANPINTQQITSGSNNPNTSITFDPTQQRVYPPYEGMIV